MTQLFDDKVNDLKRHVAERCSEGDISLLIGKKITRQSQDSLERVKHIAQAKIRPSGTVCHWRLITNWMAQSSGYTSSIVTVADVRTGRNVRGRWIAPRHDLRSHQW